MDGAHDAGDDRGIIVEGFRHGSEAVGGTGGCGDDLVIRGQGLIVDAVDDGGKVVACRSRDDDFLGTRVDVRLGLRFGSVETGAFEDDVDIEFAPGKFGSVGLGIDGDLFAVDRNGVLTGFDRVQVLADATAETALSGIEFQKIRKHCGSSQIVDRDDFITFRVEHLTEREAADTAKSVNSYFNHGKQPPVNKEIHVFASMTINCQSAYFNYTCPLK